MEGAARVFAGEFNASTLQVPGTGGDDAPWIITPGGGWCRRLFLVGALTERVESGEMLRCRLADPTGAFDLVAGGRNSPGAAAIRDLPIPSFISVTGSARMYQKNGTTVLSVRPEEVLPVGRPVRDQWVLTTAAHTLRRLELLEAALSGCGSADGHILAASRHYATTPAALRALVDMVETAVKSIAPPAAGEPEEAGPDARIVLLELLGSATGPRGMPVEDLLGAAAAAGLSRDTALAAIEALVVGDECYQPQKGFLRLL
ncbi:MAG TPA: hypothetical protein VEI81_00280 [Methanoregula sp.]|nr:hypothetical protein [Methanoregula sp.]